MRACFLCMRFALYLQNAPKINRKLSAKRKNKNDGAAAGETTGPVVETAAGNDATADGTTKNTAATSDPGGFPTWFDMLAMIAVFFAASLMAGFCMNILRKAAPAMEHELVSIIVYLVQFGLAIGGTYLYRRVRGGTRRVFHFSIRWYNASLILLGLVLMLAGSVVMEPILRLFPDHYFESLNSAIGSGGWAILMTVLLAPLFEEMLFRGLILETAKQRWGTSVAILVSSLFFGLVHAPILPQMVNAFVMGVMLGYIYVLTDSLLSVIIIHAVNNALAFLFLEITGSQTTGLKDIVTSKALYWGIYAACLVVFVVSVVAMAVIATEKRRKRGEIAAVFAETPQPEYAEATGKSEEKEPANEEKGQ